jgi:hypothetical protein
MANVKDLVSHLLRDHTVREKVPFTPPPQPVVREESTRTTPKVREEQPPTSYAPQPGDVVRKTDTSALQLLDHTVEIDGTIGAGYLVRERGTDLGYIWPTAGGWRWVTADKREKGGASSRRIACEALQEIHSKRM